MSGSYVYCSQCKYFVTLGGDAYDCKHPKNRDSNYRLGKWFAPITTRMSPEERNKNNDCELFKPRYVSVNGR